MMRLTLELLAAVVFGALVVTLGERARRRREYYDGPYYMDQIQVLKAEKPLKLPAVRVLRGRKVPHEGWGRLATFGRRGEKSSAQSPHRSRPHDGPQTNRESAVGERTPS